MAEVSESTARDLASRLVKPPVRLLAAAGAFATVSLVAHLAGNRLANTVGYVSGTVLTIASVALFRREDARRSGSAWYTPDGRLPFLAIGILVVGLTAAAFHIWYLSEVPPS